MRNHFYSWGVATLTTVGYGNIYPITFIGKVLSGIIVLLGIGLVALPTGIISSGFMEEMDRKSAENEEKNCLVLIVERNLKIKN